MTAGRATAFDPEGAPRRSRNQTGMRIQRRDAETAELMPRRRRGGRGWETREETCPHEWGMAAWKTAPRSGLPQRTVPRTGPVVEGGGKPERKLAPTNGGMAAWKTAPRSGLPERTQKRARRRRRHHSFPGTRGGSRERGGNILPIPARIRLGRYSQSRLRLQLRCVNPAATVRSCEEMRPQAGVAS